MMRKGRMCMYKNHERKLIWLAFGVAAIMLISIFGRLFGS